MPSRGDIKRDLGALRRSVMRDLALGADRPPLTVALSDGSRPLVFALEAETMETAIERLTSVGGTANVVVGMNDGQVVVMNAYDDECAPHPGVTPFGGIPGHVSIGMFIATLRTTPGGASIRLTPDGSVTPIDLNDLVGAAAWK